ncbi:hypothetical protein [Biformimicrobium ophioploci]|uniref:Uncharacterized protein n=1 Tax=Biformimicrobium ophioploci TaxID=3036711 RepID=A0ABQ6LW57_9GAMM|nr:hypothetical protein [Microbulbifer sp. NKW57]GMG86349.1 hypothetical protein MNKW57_06700 [Microbulbifer sp. NKW57]
MRLVIGNTDQHDCTLQVASFALAKRPLRERPVTVLQVSRPAPSRDSLVSLLTWAAERAVLPQQVVLSQVSTDTRLRAANWLQARGYRSADRVNFFRL